jgi:hypothetical protein
MLVLSATQAIAPAVERTRNLLFRPFAFGTFLKLCAVGVLTEGYSGNFNFSNHHQAGHLATPPLGFHMTPALAAALVMIAIAVLVLSVVLVYLVARLRFALFDCLVHQTRLIAPGWHKYRFQAFRFFLVSIAIGLAFLSAVALVLIPFALGFFHLYREGQSTGHFPVAAAIALALPLIPVFLVIVLAAFFIDLVLRDFMLPHMALEDASAAAAWAAAWASIAREAGPFFLYAVLRILLPVAAGIALVLALALPSIVVFGALGLLFTGVHAAAAGATVGVAAVATLFEVALGLVIAALALLLALCFGGPLSIALRNYALVFYGGRYAALGNLLEPPLAPAPASPAA